jgi:hypothetical protein
MRWTRSLMNRSFYKMFLIEGSAKLACTNFRKFNSAERSLMKFVCLCMKNLCGLVPPLIANWGSE